MSTDTEYHEMQKDLEPAAPLRNECASCGQDAGDGNVCRACVEALGYPVKPALEAMASEAPGDADYEALGYEETRQGSTGQFDLDTWVDRRLYVMQQAGVYWCRETARHEFYSR